MKYLKLIRWPYLLLIFASQFLIKYTLFEPFNLSITLNWFGIFLLSLSMVCLAAAGFVIDSIYNVKADEVNQPEKQLIGRDISIKKANKLFFIFNIVGVIIGFYLSNIIGHPSFAILFILTSVLLYANASSLKKYVLAAPVILSFLVGLSVISIALFDLFPAITDQNRETAKTFFSILVDYFIFISLLNLCREIIVNQINIDGDYKFGRKSLPLVLGKDRTNKIIFILTLLPIVAVAYYVVTYLYMHVFTMVYAIVLILAPLFYALVKIMSATSQRDYMQLNTVLKLVMIFSFLSIGLYQFILI